MIKPSVPKNEAERLHALRALQILDSSHEERFDRVTRMAKRMFGVSISLVSLVDEDRQWFKSAQGLDASETPREISFVVTPSIKKACSLSQTHLTMNVFLTTRSSLMRQIFDFMLAIL